MATIPEQCWQIAAGDTNRNYADICLRHSAIMMGPGSNGIWNNSLTRKTLMAEGWSSRKVTTLEIFCNSIRPGDMIVLRLGTSEVHGVGIVRGSYEHNNFFADVDGWDLNHYFRVEWIWSKPNGKPEVFKGALKFGDTTQRLYRSEKTESLFQWIERLPDPLGSPLQDLKRPGDVITPADISRRLFDYGVGSGSLSCLENSIKDLCSLAQWYQRYQVDPSERETVAHLVVPLLTALGWTPQTIKLELPLKGIGSADVALYANGNRRDYEPIVIIEAKKFGTSCLTADTQARMYAEKLHHVRRLIVTDGIRYGVFIADQTQRRFGIDPNAYLNLTEPRDCYPAYGDCQGGDEAMLYMSSSWNQNFGHPAVRLASEKMPEEV